MEAKLEEERITVDKPLNSPRKSSVPRADEVTRLAPRSNVNFLSRNKFVANEPAMRKPSKSKDDLMKDVRHDEFGRVPRYLEDRKSQWREEEEESRRRAPDPNCPPGMKLMPDDERLSTLEILKANRDEAMKQLGKVSYTNNLCTRMLMLLIFYLFAQRPSPK